MNKQYNTPEFDVIKFVLKNDILGESTEAIEAENEYDDFEIEQIPW